LAQARERRYHSRQATHGLRRCASTILNETGLFEPDWVETQLAHIDQNKVRGAYNAAVYLNHRARMLQWWAVYRFAAVLSGERERQDIAE
jgi:hypothetical protein